MRAGEWVGLGLSALIVAGAGLAAVRGCSRPPEVLYPPEAGEEKTFIPRATTEPDAGGTVFVTPPNDDGTNDIRIPVGDGKRSLVDKGGKSRACDQGCVVFADGELRAKAAELVKLYGDAGGEAGADAAAEARTKALEKLETCFRSCVNNGPAVEWPK